MADEFTVPSHYIQLAKELGPLIAQIQSAVINRPVPSGLPRERNLGDICPLFDENAVVVAELTDALNNADSKVLIQSSVTDNEIRGVVETLAKPLSHYIGIYHAFCSRPFPSGLEEGVYLFSAGLERVLKQLLEGLERLTMIIERPEKAIEKFGSATVHFNIIFDATDEFMRA
ncbi:MAG: hypothetical protein HZB37_02860, partial [Planctomycetes bacterium]|nr:hypothetical protein [Planctomycetota bacterium]